MTSTAGALALLVGAGWRPRVVWRWAPVRTLLRVGVPLTASTLVLTARYRLFALVLGGTAGAAALGETHMAFRLVDTARDLCSTALWRLMLPVLAESQRDEAALREAVDRLLQRSGAVMLPLCAAMALCLPSVVDRLLGPAWSAAGLAAEPLIALMALLMLMFPAGVAVVARGQTGRALGGSVACLVTTLTGVAWLRPANAVQAVLVWCGAQAVVVPYSLWVNGSAIGTGLLRPLRAGMALAGLTLAGMAAVLAMRAVIGEPDGTVALVVLRLAVFGAVVLGGMAWCGRAGLRRVVFAAWFGRLTPVADRPLVGPPLETRE